MEYSLTELKIMHLTTITITHLTTYFNGQLSKVVYETLIVLCKIWLKCSPCTLYTKSISILIVINETEVV